MADLSPGFGRMSAQRRVCNRFRRGGEAMAAPQIVQPQSAQQRQCAPKKLANPGSATSSPSRSRKVGVTRPKHSDRIPTGPAIRTPGPFMRTVSTRIGSSNDAPVMAPTSRGASTLEGRPFLGLPVARRVGMPKYRTTARTRIPKRERLRLVESEAATPFGSWLRGQDSNLRPSGYEPDELPDCSTPRRWIGAAASCRGPVRLRGRRRVLEDLAATYSPTPRGAVPSALRVFTAEFGMGSGTGPSL